ncbi:MAG: hypothetical protein E7588_10280 [Ruminococcaceae bacterium]|nr:hypothetical protein [Oscillospiraceae bacterium]
MKPIKPIADKVKNPKTIQNGINLGYSDITDFPSREIAKEYPKRLSRHFAPKLKKNIYDDVKSI